MGIHLTYACDFRPAPGLLDADGTPTHASVHGSEGAGAAGELSQTTQGGESSGSGGSSSRDLESATRGQEGGDTEGVGGVAAGWRWGCSKLRWRSGGGK